MASKRVTRNGGRRSIASNLKIEKLNDPLSFSPKKPQAKKVAVAKKIQATKIVGQKKIQATKIVGQKKIQATKNVVPKEIQAVTVVVQKEIQAATVFVPKEIQADKVVVPKEIQAATAVVQKEIQAEKVIVDQIVHQVEADLKQKRREQMTLEAARVLLTVTKPVDKELSTAQALLSISPTVSPMETLRLPSPFSLLLSVSLNSKVSDFGISGLFNSAIEIKPEPGLLKRGAQSEGRGLAKRQRVPNPYFYGAEYNSSKPKYGENVKFKREIDLDILNGVNSVDTALLSGYEEHGTKFISRGTARHASSMVPAVPKVKYSRLCIEPECMKNAQGATRKCIAHGGGKRCIVDDCTKSAQGTTRKCKAHGGGRRCNSVNCTKSARGSTEKCKAHGGGRRCGKDDCNNSAAGSTFRCITHGGGRKCIAEGCTKSAAGSTQKCKAHGGGRRCMVEGCAKSAQGATFKCIAHGGGRRCNINGCTKSAQGATDKCKAHGGGKRCDTEGCNKTVYRATARCKAHGEAIPFHQGFVSSLVKVECF
jgi:hypothetical protein